eukprot:366568-Chlamydomonas_euryale.AAC.15
MRFGRAGGHNCRCLSEGPKRGGEGRTHVPCGWRRASSKLGDARVQIGGAGQGLPACRRPQVERQQPPRPPPCLSSRAFIGLVIRGMGQTIVRLLRPCALSIRIGRLRCRLRLYALILLPWATQYVSTNAQRRYHD